MTRGINPARWWEYSISASLMVVLIAMLTGIQEVTALIGLFGVNAAMILSGLVMERVNAGRAEVDWRPFVYGCVAGAVPWIAIGAQIAVAESDRNGVPGFVVAIFVTLFLLFNSFAVNMWLGYRKAGRYTQPAVGRAVLPRVEPGRQERARLAGVRGRARRQLTSRSGDTGRHDHTLRMGAECRPAVRRLPRRGVGRSLP